MRELPYREAGRARAQRTIGLFNDRHLPLEATVKAQLHPRVAGLRLIAVGMLVVLSLPGCLIAQIDRGEITGTVEDPSGAVVQKATITLTNDDTTARITSKSTGTGTYVFDGVIPGNYTIEAGAPGFEQYVVHGVLVHVQQVLTVD